MEQSNIPGEKMKHNRLLLFGTLLIVSFAIMGNIRATTYECDSCESCDSAIANACSTGDIVLLNQSIITSSDCITTEWCENEITFDCQGLSISGGSDYGVIIDSSTDSSIINCVISGFTYGIYLTQVNNVNLINNVINVSGEDIGIYFDINSNYGDIHNNTIFGEDVGNALIYFDGSENNVFYNNTFNTTDELYYFNRTGIEVSEWNKTTYGNTWFLVNGFGFSQICADTNNDGFCDIPYDILGDGSNIDYFPLMTGIKDIINCNSQITCNIALNSTSYRNKVAVVSNFSVGIGGLLFNADYAGDNAIFDCNGYTLTLTTSDNPLLKIYRGSGSSATDPFNITVQNCRFIGGVWGLWLESGKNHTIKNNIFLNNIYFDSDYTIIENNTFSSLIDIRTSTTGIIRNNNFNGGTAIGLYATATSGLFYNNNITATSGPVFDLAFNLPVWIFYNNYIYAPSNSNYITFTSNPSKFNTTNQTGPNIIGGKYIGGNYWLNSTGGFSLECADVNNDDYCDTYLSFEYLGNFIYDYLPLTINLTGNITENETSPGPISNETIIFQIDSNLDSTITKYLCSDNNTLKIESNIQYCVSGSGNFTPNCYYINKTKYQNCAYGCYPGVVENGDYCSPPDYILWGFGLIVFFVAIFLINRYYRGR